MMDKNRCLLSCGIYHCLESCHASLELTWFLCCILVIIDDGDEHDYYFLRCGHILFTAVVGFCFSYCSERAWCWWLCVCPQLLVLGFDSAYVAHLSSRKAWPWHCDLSNLSKAWPWHWQCGVDMEACKELAFSRKTCTGQKSLSVVMFDLSLHRKLLDTALCYIGMFSLLRSMQ